MKIKLLFFCASLFFACKNGNTTQTNNFESKDALEYPENKSIKNNDSLALQKIIKKAIDLPELQQYYHVLELPSRSPLVVHFNTKDYKNLELFKFGKPVEIVNNINTVKNKPHLKFNVVNVEEAKASLDFDYKVEGINVLMELNKINGNWIVVNSKIIEK